MAIQITQSDLQSKVQEGWKKAALAEHYGLPMTQMGRVLKDAGLTIRKFHAPKYELIRDEVEQPTINTAVAAETQVQFEEQPALQAYEQTVQWSEGDQANPVIVLGIDLAESINTPVMMEARADDISLLDALSEATSETPTSPYQLAAEPINDLDVQGEEVEPLEEETTAQAEW